MIAQISCDICREKDIRKDYLETKQNTCISTKKKDHVTVRQKIMSNIVSPLLQISVLLLLVNFCPSFPNS